MSCCIVCEFWEKKTSKDCFIFRHAGVPSVWFVITKDKFIFQMRYCQAHCSLYWVNNCIHICMWNTGVLEDILSSFCWFMEKRLNVLREVLCCYHLHFAFWSFTDPCQGSNFILREKYLMGCKRKAVVPWLFFWCSLRSLWQWNRAK